MRVEKDYSTTPSVPLTRSPPFTGSFVYEQFLALDCISLHSMGMRCRAKEESKFVAREILNVVSRHLFDRASQFCRREKGVVNFP